MRVSSASANLTTRNWYLQSSDLVVCVHRVVLPLILFIKPISGIWNFPSNDEIFDAMIRFCFGLCFALLCEYECICWGFHDAAFLMVDRLHVLHVLLRFPPPFLSLTLSGCNQMASFQRANHGNYWLITISQSAISPELTYPDSASNFFPQKIRIRYWKWYLRVWALARVLWLYMGAISVSPNELQISGIDQVSRPSLTLSLFPLNRATFFSRLRLTPINGQIYPGFILSGNQSE